MSRPPEQKDLLAEPQYFFSGDGKDNKVELAFLLVRPVKEEGSFTSSQKSVATLRQLIGWDHYLSLGMIDGMPREGMRY